MRNRVFEKTKHCETVSQVTNKHLTNFTNMSTKQTEMPKASLNTLELNITSVCNLRCTSCSHFSWLLPQVHPPTEQLLEQITTWATKLSAKTVRIQGGEPTLHPGLEEIIRHVCQVFEQPTIEIWTNGTTLRNGSFLPVENYHAKFHVSVHHDRFVVPQSVPVCRTLDRKKHELRYRVVEGKPVPIFASARGKCRCLHKTLLNGKLYHCAVLPFIAGYFKDIYQCDYVPATPDFTHEQLMEWLKQPNGELRSNACDICNVHGSKNLKRTLELPVL